MSRLVSQGTKKIDFDNNEWIEYREKLSYGELEPILTALDAFNAAANIKMAMPLLEIAITGWNLKGDSGAEIPFEKEKIKSLDTPTVLQIFAVIIKEYFPENQKKNLNGSAE